MEAFGLMECSPIETLRPGSEGELPYCPHWLRNEAPAHIKSSAYPHRPRPVVSLINLSEQFGANGCAFFNRQAKTGLAKVTESCRKQSSPYRARGRRRY
jgi:hypothetical protein